MILHPMVFGGYDAFIRGAAGVRWTTDPRVGRTAGGRRIAYVSVSFSLSPSGQVIGPMVTKAPRGVPGIRSAALSAARSCRYASARIDGRPVGVRGLVRTFAFEV